jgi:hypothetical protein
MARIASVAHITLTSYAACVMLVACGDGTGDPGGGYSGSANTPTAGSAPVAGTTSSAGTTGSAGTASTTGGNPSGGSATGGSSPTTGGNPSGGNATGGTSAGGQGTGGTPSGGQSTGGSGGTAGTSSGGMSGAAGTAGSGGTGTTPSCNSSETLCSGKCVDTDEDAKNCSGCGKACGSQQECNNAKCECTGDLTLCSSACVNTDTDVQNCGSCGKKCSSGQTCKDGACNGGTTTTGCSNITEFGTVSSTIVVKNGQTYDGQCKRFRADPDKLGDGSQAEGQKPVFIVENGGKLINVVLGAPAADGIHTEGSVTLENITWEDIGEDAMTIKEGGTVILNGGSAKNGDDKVFQINAASTFRVSNFKAQNAGKFIRQNGGTTFKTQVYIDKCDISDMDEAVFRTDSSTSTVSFTNSRYHNIGDSLFIGVSSGNITQSNNTSY